MFQAIFEKVDGFGWWDLERISEDAGAQYYLNRVSERMSNLRCLVYVKSYGASGNGPTGQSDMENIV